MRGRLPQLKVLFFLFLMAGGLTVSCDRFEDDAAPELNLAALELHNDIVQMRKGEVAKVINLLGNDEVSQTASVHFLKQPQLGDISFLPEGLLLYQLKNPNFPSSFDEIVYSVCGNGSQCDTAEVFINIGAEVGLDFTFICQPSGSADVFHLAPNETIFANVLANDVFCNQQADLSTFKISWQEGNGSISAKDGTLEFISPNAFSDEIFKVVYEVALEGQPNQKLYAAAYFYTHTQEEECYSANLYLEKDGIELQTLPGLQSYELDVLENDQFCDWKVDWPAFSLMLYPGLGTAFIRDRKIIYTPYPGEEGEDFLSYQLCQNGDCQVGEVSIQLHPAPTTPCTIQEITLRNDEFGFINPQGEFVTYHSLLENDLFCPENVDWDSFYLTRFPENGEAYVEGEFLYYNPDPGFEGVDYVRYQLCDSLQCYEATASVFVNWNQCSIIARDDHVTATYQAGNVIVIDLLENDTACSEELEIDISADEYSQNGYFEVSGGKLIFYPSEFEGDEVELVWEYNLCYNVGGCDSATVILKLKK